MKKFISLLLVLTMVMSLVACGNNTADNAGSDTQTGNTHDSLEGEVAVVCEVTDRKSVV